MSKKEEANWGVFAAEMLIAWLLARAAQEWFTPDAWMMILVPVMWVVVHFTVGKVILKYLTKDIF